MTPEPHVNGVPLREYVEALFEQERRRSEREADEREKAARALREQQYRAMETAEHEREKAAEVLRAAMERAVTEGDDRLREHIANQVMQIKGALDSAERLETTRIKASDEAREGLRREVALITESSRQAVLKAEASQKEVNEKSNEFRAQLGDQAATLMPRKEAESRSAEIDRRIDEARVEREHRLGVLDQRIQLLERGASGRRATDTSTDRIVGFFVGGVGLLVAAVVAANAVFGGG